jgi:anti-sigma factor RsiW
MKDCGEHSVSVQLYLDHELSGGELEDFLAHLETCVACEETIQVQRELSSLLYRSRPLYTVPDMLRERLLTSALQPRSAESPAPASSAGRVTTVFVELSKSIFARPRHWEALAALALILAVSALLFPQVQRRSNAARYVEGAVAAHRSFLEGKLPLEVQSDSPATVTAWFAGKVPFVFRLPDSRGTAVQEPIYKLVGGRLVNYRGGYAALVAYQAKQEKISLLVTSTQAAPAAGGEEVDSGGIAFHYSKQANFNVIAWSNHGLTYALVSSLPGSGRQSCLVCHQSMADGDNFSLLR